MTAETRRTILRHAVAIDLMIMAVGAAWLVPGSPAVLFGSFLAAVALSAWLGGDEVGLAATAYAVVALSVFFGRAVDVGSLTAFAATGAVVSTIARAARAIQRREELPPRAEARPFAAAIPFAIGLPLLVVVLYTDLSDIVMENLPVPSLLQPLIMLLAFVVWKYRHTLQPSSAAAHPIVAFMVLYALVVFSTSIWAKDTYLADKRFSETLKAVFVAVLAASLAASWTSLRRAFIALIASAALLSSLSVLQIATGRFGDAFFGLVELKSGTIYGDVSMPRAAGPPVSDPNFYARILLMTIPLSVSMAFMEKRPRRRFAYAAAAAITTAATLVTYSRGAMLTLAVMAMLLALTLRVKLRHIALAGVAGIIVLLMLPSSITRRLGTIEALLPDHNTGAAYDSSLAQRELLTLSGVAMFEAHPWFGVGAGHYAWYFPQYSNLVGSSWIDYVETGINRYPHSFYVEVACETGLAGLISILAAVLAAFLTLYRTHAQLRHDGDREHATWASALAVAIAGYLIASVFLHETHLRYIALYFGFVIATARLARKQVSVP
ncbi:MAG TPA: O-antigen ligase family protein [Thermoanaerobaculia bacterium]